MGILSGLIGGALGLFGQHQDQHFQREMANTSVQRRVRDANAAGVSPLFALGAPTMNFSSSIGSTLGAAGSEIGSGFEQMGQDFTRARAAGMDSSERAAATGIMGRLAVERGGLENELLRAQIARIRTSTPAVQTQPLIPGQAPRDPDATPMGIVLPEGTVMESGATSPANTWEQQYGDIVQNAAGTVRLGIDAYRNFVRPYLDRGQGYVQRYDYSNRRGPANSGYPRGGGTRY